MKNRYKNHARKKRAKRWKINKKVIQKDPLGPNMASKITQWRQNDRGSHPGGRILCGPADESCFRYRPSPASLHLNGLGEGFLEFPLRHCRFSAAPRSAGLIQFSGLIFWRCWGASCSKVLLVCCSTRSAGLNQCLFTQASGIYRCCQQKGIGKNWPAFGLV